MGKPRRVERHRPFVGMLQKQDLDRICHDLHMVAKA
jgi:hypothetical protein